MLRKPAMNTHQNHVGLRRNPEPETEYIRALRQMVEDQLDEEARICALAAQREIEDHTWLDAVFELSGLDLIVLVRGSAYPRC